MIHHFTYAHARARTFAFNRTRWFLRLHCSHARSRTCLHASKVIAYLIFVIMSILSKKIRCRPDTFPYSPLNLYSSFIWVFTQLNAVTDLYWLGEERCKSLLRNGKANDVGKLLQIAIVGVAFTWRTAALTRCLHTHIRPNFIILYSVQSVIVICVMFPALNICPDIGPGVY